MLVIPATWMAENEGLWLKANLGQKKAKEILSQRESMVWFTSVIPAGKEAEQSVVVSLQLWAKSQSHI
jgi:SRSO17 transposase